MRPTRTLRRVVLTALLTLAVISPPAAAGPGIEVPRPAPLAAQALPAPPPTPKGLPNGIEALSGYLQQNSCDPRDKKGSVALGRLLVATYPGTSFGVGRACAADGMASEHYEGRAVDWMVSVRKPAQAAQARAVVRWLLAEDAAGRPYAMARRLGVMYLIWDDRIWGSYAAGDGWRPYSTCASRPERAFDTTCHRDHIHISLSWAGATARTSFWSGKVARPDYGPCRPADLNWAPPYRAPRDTPCTYQPKVTAPAGSSATAAALVRYSGATLRPGQTGPVVTAVQRALDVAADGAYGPITSAAVSRFRTLHGVPAGTTVNQATWRALLKAFVPPPVGSAAGGAGAGSGGGGGSGAGGSESPLTRYKHLVLQYDSSGPAVVALQKRLRVTPTSGWFGPLTRAAVKRFQSAHGLPSTGVVAARTWKALGA